MGRSSPRPDALVLPGDRTGVLLLHGFTGSPAELRPVAHALATQGWTVHAPLLPGHGTAPDDLAQRRFTEWVTCASEHLVALRSRCDRVVVGGLSMGALLALHLASEPDAGISGALLYAPALRLRAPVLPLTPLARSVLSSVPVDHAGHLADPSTAARMWAYDVYPVAAAAQLYALQQEVLGRLEHIVCDLLVVVSEQDPAVPPEVADLLLERAGSARVVVERLTRSGHPVTIDAEWRRVADVSASFVRGLVSRASRGEAPPR